MAIQPKTFRVFTVGRTALYGGLCAAVTGAIAKALHYNLVVLKTPLDARFYVLSSMVLVAFYYIAFLVFQARKKFKDLISFYTSQGMAVLAGSTTKFKDTMSMSAVLEPAIEKTIKFWTAWAENHGKFIGTAETVIRGYINGGVLGLDQALLTYYVAGTSKFAVGLTNGNTVNITWRETDTDDRTSSLVCHELGHVCLYALGVEDLTGEDHHKIMLEAQFGH
jgi:hypothetical protein